MKVNPVIYGEVIPGLAIAMEVDRLSVARDLRKNRPHIIEIKRFVNDGYPIRHYIVFINGVKSELRTMTVPQERLQ